MMSEKVEDLTIAYEEDGKLLTKELDKAVLTKGAWATVMFRYQAWDKKKEEYGPEKYMVRRYRKMNGVYSPQSKFNISSRAQAEKVIEILQGWIKEP